MSDDQTDRSGSIYSFGETNLAARPGLALDLGCGPGFTTRLLSRVARPERTVGVDRSKAFLSQARAGAAAGKGYVTADVAVAPLRIAGIGAQPDLIYARFLSSHLPEQAVAGWAKELAAGGLLLLEEVDSISTEVAAFDEYLKIASEVLAQYGNELFVGARLATSRWDADLCNRPRSLISTRQHSADRLLVRSVVSSWAKHP
jgi:trans-aconitate 2-methyltransferase